jgi:hypothetical protein
MRKQFERDKVRRPCIKLFRTLINYNILNKYDFLYWACPPDLGNLPQHIANNMKLDGYEKGVFDLTIIAGNKDILKVWLIEFKYGSNGYTKEQKTIAENTEYIKNIEAIKIKNIDEFQLFIDNNLK